MDLGYLNAAALFGALIGLTAAFYLFRANNVLCFWIAYIPDAPFGASCGDLLSQPPGNGDWSGATGTSILFLLTILSLVGYLTFRDKVNVRKICRLPDLADHTGLRDPGLLKDK
jgi:uncharacterized membrane-anchored protein